MSNGSETMGYENLDVSGTQRFEIFKPVNGSCACAQVHRPKPHGPDGVPRDFTVVRCPSGLLSFN